MEVPNDGSKNSKIWSQELSDKSRKSKSLGQHTWDKVKNEKTVASPVEHASSSKEAVEVSVAVMIIIMLTYWNNLLKVIRVKEKLRVNGWCW